MYGHYARGNSVGGRGLSKKGGMGRESEEARTDWVLGIVKSWECNSVEDWDVGNKSVSSGSSRQILEIVRG